LKEEIQISSSCRIQFFVEAKFEGFPGDRFGHRIQTEAESIDESAILEKSPSFPFKPIFWLTTILGKDGRIVQSLTRCQAEN